MALTDCPSCGKKISDKAVTCQHCGFGVKGASSDDIARKQHIKRYKKLASLQNQSLVATFIVIAGFGFMYWGAVKSGDTQHNLAIGSIIIGFLWYVINRVRIVLIKRSQ